MESNNVNSFVLVQVTFHSVYCTCCSGAPHFIMEEEVIEDCCGGQGCFHCGGLGGILTGRFETFPCNYLRKIFFLASEEAALKMEKFEGQLPFPLLVREVVVRREIVPTSRTWAKVEESFGGLLTLDEGEFKITPIHEGEETNVCLLHISHISEVRDKRLPISELLEVINSEQAPGVRGVQIENWLFEFCKGTPKDWVYPNRQFFSEGPDSRKTFCIARR